MEAKIGYFSTSEPFLIESGPKHLWETLDLKSIVYLTIYEGLFDILVGGDCQIVNICSFSALGFQSFIFKHIHANCLGDNSQFSWFYLLSFG